jgi:hypothetical protein
MAASTQKGDAFGQQQHPDTVKAIRSLQLGHQNTDVRLKKMEESTKGVADARQKLEEKMDGIHKFLMEWNSSNEFLSLVVVRNHLDTLIPNHPTSTTNLCNSNS